MVMMWVCVWVHESKDAGKCQHRGTAALVTKVLEDLNIIPPIFQALSITVAMGIVTELSKQTHSHF